MGRDLGDPPLLLGAMGVLAGAVDKKSEGLLLAHGAQGAILRGEHMMRCADSLPALGGVS